MQTKENKMEIVDEMIKNLPPEPTQVIVTDSEETKENYTFEDIRKAILTFLSEHRSNVMQYNIIWNFPTIIRLGRSNGQALVAEFRPNTIKYYDYQIKNDIKDSPNLKKYDDYFTGKITFKKEPV